MARKRGSAHTTLTDTADLVVRELERIGGIKMIAPGIIDARRSGTRYVTVSYTPAGFELLISGTGVQKVAVHVADPDQSHRIITTLKQSKKLNLFQWNERERKPGV